MQVMLHCLLLLTYLASSQGLERKLKWTLNPGCEEETNNTEWCSEVLAHVTAEGPNDTVHYVWGFLGRPTFLLALTEPGVGLNVSWKELLFGPEENSLKFTSTPLYSFGIAFNRILEFHDVNDTANLEHVSDDKIVSMDTHYFDWALQSVGLDKDGSLVLQVQASNYTNNNISRYGNLSITVSGYGQDGHGAQLPHLLHSANCSQLEVTLQGLETSPQFEGRSRFALELLVASSEQAGASVTTHRSLDDEHTPGVFTVAELLTPLTRAGGRGGFIQWRPVAYTLPARDIESSTETRHYEVRNVSQPVVTFNNTLLFAFYGYDLQSHLAESFNVSFGVSEDGFYNTTQYSTWSLSVGYGQPPEERLSLLVMLILGVGLGLPMLLLLVGGLYLLLRRPGSKKDDLFLSR